MQCYNKCAEKKLRIAVTNRAFDLCIGEGACDDKCNEQLEDMIDCHTMAEECSGYAVNNFIVTIA